jgi:hypothetical protein
MYEPDNGSGYSALGLQYHCWVVRAGLEAGSADYTVDLSRLGLYRRPDRPTPDTRLHATANVVDLPCGP